jgi:hypothetical protein
MPNHVSNKLMFECADSEYEETKAKFDLVVQLMKTEDNDFDFNALIPYPKEYQWADEARAKALKEGVDWSKAPKDGFNGGGYEWRVANWGTKWNAYDVCVKTYGEITFQTAWDTPTPIFQALSSKFPDITFRVEYADEEWGRNCGIASWKAGKELGNLDDTTWEDYPWRLFAEKLWFEVRYQHTGFLLEKTQEKYEELKARFETELEESV